MTLDQFKQVWARAAEKIAAREKDYSALDAAAGGDGDHGEAIVAATRALAAAQGADFKSLLETVTRAKSLAGRLRFTVLLSSPARMIDRGLSA